MNLLHEWARISVERACIVFFVNLIVAIGFAVGGALARSSRVVHPEKPGAALVAQYERAVASGRRFYRGLGVFCRLFSRRAQQHGGEATRV